MIINQKECSTLKLRPTFKDHLLRKAKSPGPVELKKKLLNFKEKTSKNKEKKAVFQHRGRTVMSAGALSNITSVNSEHSLPKPEVQKDPTTYNFTFKDGDSTPMVTQIELKMKNALSSNIETE